MEKKKAGSELQKLKKALELKEAQLREYTDHLKRLQAEVENYTKRVEKERAQVADTASEKLIVKLLLVFDDFERALNQMKDAPDTVKKGVEMIFKELHKILDEAKVAPIQSVGGKVDPYKHEVMLQVEDDKEQCIILEELQKGYTMNGKVIRYAKVKISGGKK